MPSTKRRTPYNLVSGNIAPSLAEKIVNTGEFIPDAKTGQERLAHLSDIAPQAPSYLKFTNRNPLHLLNVIVGLEVESPSEFFGDTQNGRIAYIKNPTIRQLRELNYFAGRTLDLLDQLPETARPVSIGTRDENRQASDGSLPYQLDDGEKDAQVLAKRDGTIKIPPRIPKEAYLSHIPDETTAEAKERVGYKQELLRSGARAPSQQAARHERQYGQPESSKSK